MKNAEPLNTHEQSVYDTLLAAVGYILGFPDTKPKLEAIARAYARFASTEPYKLQVPAHLKPHLTETQMAEMLAPQQWKEGVVPMEWLADKIADTCRFFPMPIEARRIYEAAGFRPLDGHTADSISNERPEGTAKREREED